jgi:hypothetical protein
VGNAASISASIRSSSSRGTLAPKGALHYSQQYEDYYAAAAREIEALNPLPG